MHVYTCLVTYLRILGGDNKMGKYSESAKQLLEYVGGSDNISVVTHCATRMRFVLNVLKQADV